MVGGGGLNPPAASEPPSHLPTPEGSPPSRVSVLGVSRGVTPSGDDVAVHSQEVPTSRSDNLGSSEELAETGFTQPEENVVAEERVGALPVLENIGLGLHEVSEGSLGESVGLFMTEDGQWRLSSFDEAFDAEDLDFPREFYRSVDLCGELPVSGVRLEDWWGEGDPDRVLLASADTLVSSWRYIKQGSDCFAAFEL